MAKVTSAIVVLAALLFTSASVGGCGHRKPGTSKWMKSLNSIKAGTEMGRVRSALGPPDVKRRGETPVRPYPPTGSPEGVLSTLPADTKYEQWIYKRGDSRYHVFFQRTALEPHKWEVVATRSAPAAAVY